MNRVPTSLFLALTIACTSGCTTAAAPPPPASYTWTRLPAEPYKGKQDDIFFVDAGTGWYVNGQGKIYKTTDGGRSWTLKLHKPGTYFRCIGFLDAKRGFAGNIGTDYYPGVTDTTPLYETRDGGETWTAVTNIKGPAVKGLCAIEVTRDRVYAAGRVGGPAFMLVSNDRGESWQSFDLRAHTAAIYDVEFVDAKTGFICGASDATIANANAVILMTRDAGRTWTKQYQSSRPYEITWKSSFPTKDTGYVTIQSYDPDKSVTQRYVAKSVDGGKTWTELPLTSDYAVREFGIAFRDRNTGWVGTTTTGFETRDGGATWNRVEMGKAVNKIRLLDRVGYAIGTEVWKLTW